MAQARDEAGNIWEVDTQGNAVRLIQAAPRQGTVITDPTAPLKQDQMQGGITRTNQDIQAKSAELPYAPTVAAAQARSAVAGATKAELEAQKAARDLASQPSPNPETAKGVQRLQQDEVLNAIDQARQNSSGWSTGLAGQLLKGIWGTQAADLEGSLNTVGSGLTLDKLGALKQASSTGASGLGALSEREGALLRDSVAAIGQNQSKEQLLANLGKVETHYRRYRALLDGQNPDQPQIAQQYGLAVPGAQSGGSQSGGGGPSGGPNGDPYANINPSGGGGGQLTSQGTFNADPALKGVNSKVASMIKSGVPAAGIRQYLDSIRPGMGSQVSGLEDAISYAHQYPNRPTNIDVEKVWVPASGVSQTLGNIGMSPLGAGVIGAADTLSLGTLDNLQSNPALARATMAGVSEANPTSYMLGQIGGGALSGIGLEAGLGRAGLGAANSTRVADALFGAGYGAGTADDPGQSRVANALLGVGSGVAGGVLGRGTARVGGRALTGVRDGARQALDAAGISMTPGQILGGTVQRTEDRLAGLPFVGDQIRNRRMEGVTDFNNAAFDQALAPIGQTTNGVIGEAGIDLARQARSGAYSAALDPVRVQADAPFIQDMQGVIQQGQRLPGQMAQNADYTLQTRVGDPLGQTGQFTGNDYQQMLRGLRQDANSLEQQPYGYDFANVTRGAEDALQGVLQRQSPETVGALQTANEVNRNVETLRDAVNRARNGSRTGNVGTFAPSQLADAAAASAKKYGNSQGTTNQPFFDLTRAAQQVLPSSVPDSGTAGRSVIAALLASTLGGGAGAAAGEEGHKAQSGLTGAVVAGLLASAPYSAAARNTIQRALLAERPQVVQRAGDIIYNNDRIAGLLAAPSLVDYSVGP